MAKKSTVEQIPYIANKKDCDDIIDSLLDGIRHRDIHGPLENGVQRQMLMRSEFLETSSKEALKEVFKDPVLGVSAFNYLSKLNSTDKKTPEEIETDNTIFTLKANDTKDLFSQNIRKVSIKDAFDQRVVGANMAKDNASALKALPFFCLLFKHSINNMTQTKSVVNFSVSLGLAAFAFSFPLLLVASSYISTYGDDITGGKDVTIIHSGKKVKANSLSEPYKDDGISHEARGGDCKDLLFYKMTGKISPPMEKVRNDAINVISEALAAHKYTPVSNELLEKIVLGDKKVRKSIKDLNASHNKIGSYWRKAVLKKRLNPKPEYDPIAELITSFIYPTIDEVRESRVARLNQQRQAQERIIMA